MQSTPAFEYFNRQYTDAFLRGVFPNPAPITHHISLPELGSHLVTPRSVYDHHGIYIGDEKVIHYSGLAKELKSGPIEIISLTEFLDGKTFNIELHPHTLFSANEVVHRAKTRLGEVEYKLLFNNCEHFVSWCIYNVNSSTQVEGVDKIVTGAAITAAKRSSPIVATGTAVAGTVKFISAYIKGDISGEKLLQEVSHTAITSTSSLYAAGLGQIAIPIPVVGAFIGATVGFFVGNMLHNSGRIALYEVKEAKERRQKIEQLCEKLIPEIRRSRIELEQFIDTYFTERAEDLKASFACLDSAAGDWDPDAYTVALESIGSKFGESLKLQTFEEFNSLMACEEPLCL